jgi:hypothetical protein
MLVIGPHMPQVSGQLTLMQADMHRQGRIFARCHARLESLLHNDFLIQPLDEASHMRALVLITTASLLPQLSSAQTSVKWPR